MSYLGHMTVDVEVAWLILFLLDMFMILDSLTIVRRDGYPTSPVVLI